MNIDDAMPQPSQPVSNFEQTPEQYGTDIRMTTLIICFCWNELTADELMRIGGRRLKVMKENRKDRVPVRRTSV
jgi:hypothetical protein